MAGVLRAARWFKRLRSLSCRSCARFSISFQFRMSTSSAGNLPASPSAISRSSTGAPRASSSCRRLTSSREAPRFSASASTAAFSTGLSCSRRSRTWVAILNFSTERKKRLRHWKKSQRALSRRWLHTQICDLKAQPAHAAHQPQAASSQPNARGAVSQLSGAVRKRAAGVPEARVGRQLGFQHPIAAARLPHRGQQPLAHGLGRELCVEDALGCGRQLAARPDRSRPAPRRASRAHRLQSSRWGAAPRRRPWAPMGFPAKLRSAKTAVPGTRICHLGSGRSVSAMIRLGSRK